MSNDIERACISGRDDSGTGCSPDSTSSRKGAVRATRAFACAGERLERPLADGVAAEPSVAAAASSIARIARRRSASCSRDEVGWEGVVGWREDAGEAFERREGVRGRLGRRFVGDAVFGGVVGAVGEVTGLAIGR